MNKFTSLPGWTTKINESSNGVFIVSLVDGYGRKVGNNDVDADVTIMKAMEGAFDIEKQISLNWNRFLFDICNVNLQGLVTESKYEDKHFGSWLIELVGKRIIYEGRDHWLISQLKKDDKWYDLCISTKEELTL